MKAIIQRVSRASVEVDGAVVGEIRRGFLILLGVAQGDGEAEARVLADIDGEVLVISNFTLCADCSHGRRPSFINAARPETAEPLYRFFCQRLTDNGVKKTAQGIFGADMQVSLINDGPVTIEIDSKDLKK